MRLAVLGDPVAHSLSPLLHTTALAVAGIAGTYVARRVDESGMSEAARDMRSGRLDGANITMPHKRLAAGLADRVAGVARRTGAVNTWVRVGDELIGHNTDVIGVRHAWAWGALPDDAPVLVLGAGGAAVAAAVALEERHILIAARRESAARDALAACGVAGEIHPWGTPCAGAVVVNATPIGMAGEELPPGVVEACAGLLDMAYGSEPTPAVVSATAAGLPTVDGPEMLLGQAAESFRLWTGRPAPVTAMRAALREALAARSHG